MTHINVSISLSIGRIMRFFIIISAMLNAVSCAAAEPGITLRSASLGAAERLGELEHQALNESSGLAASRRHREVLWTHNDSGGSARLFASTTKGRHLAVVRIRGALARDWEDMASFRFEGKAWLLAADVGDNMATRRNCALYVVEEPVIDPQGKDQELTVPVAWKIDFSYEDGPRDCEAVAVDAKSGRVLLVSKRTMPAVLYTLPLRPEGDGPFVARRHTPLSHIPQPKLQDLLEDPRFGKYRSQPTAMDLSPDGRIALVVTYKHAYLFPRGKGEGWEEAFARVPIPISLPERRQGESGCFSADGRAIIVGTEGRPAPLWRVPLPSVVGE